MSAANRVPSSRCSSSAVTICPISSPSSCAMPISSPGGSCGRMSSASRRFTSSHDSPPCWRLFTLHDADAHRGLAVEARQHAEIRQAVLDARHVAEADRRAVAVAPRPLQPATPRSWNSRSSLQQVLAGAADQEAARQPHVLAPERVLHVLHGEAEGGHAVELELDADGALALAADAHLAHAVDRFEALPDLRSRRRGSAAAACGRR